MMFLAAVARPRYIHSTKTWFQGKVRIWAFVYHEAEKRNSKNRPKVMIVTKNIDSVNAKQYKNMMVEKVLPAIKSKWPDPMQNIRIQEDGARESAFSCDKS